MSGVVSVKWGYFTGFLSRQAGWCRFGLYGANPVVVCAVNTASACAMDCAPAEITLPRRHFLMRRSPQSASRIAERRMVEAIEQGKPPAAAVWQYRQNRTPDQAGQFVFGFSVRRSEGALPSEADLMGGIIPATAWTLTSCRSQLNGLAG